MALESHPLRILTPSHKPPSSRPSTAAGSINGDSKELFDSKSTSRMRYAARGGEDHLAYMSRPGTAPAGRADYGTWDARPRTAIHRQKGGKLPPPGDAAGLLINGRYHGRVTPLKGKGQPPPDNKEVQRTAHRAWHPQHSHLLKHRDIFGQEGYSGIPQSASKPSKKTFATPMARSVHLVGGALVPGEGASQAPRRAKGSGVRPAYARVDTAVRTIGVGSGYTQDDVDPLDEQHSPRKRFAKGVTSWRPQDHPDVLQYKHAGAINPEYKFQSERMPNPALTQRDPQLTRALFHTASEDYAANRAKAYGALGMVTNPRPMTSPPACAA